MRAIVLPLLLAGVGVPAAAQTCPALADMRADPGWSYIDPEDCHMCIFNRIRVGPGNALSWNRRPINRERLEQYLALLHGLRPETHIELSVARNADCAFLARIVARIETTLPCERRPYCHRSLIGAPRRPRGRF
jgi:hypothetical protein